MKRKPYNYVCMAIALLVAMFLFAGCSDKGGPNGSGNGADPGTEDNGKTENVSALTGPSEKILEKILEEATAALGEGEIPATFIDPITPENAPEKLGILADDYVSYVDEASAATAAINTFAFQSAVVKCKSEDDARSIIELIIGGYDSSKWICVFPERSLAMLSGPYVLLAVGYESQTNELANAFKIEAGGVASEKRVFYEGETGGFDGGGGGMALEIEPATLD